MLPRLEIFRQCSSGELAERDNALLLTFAENSNELLRHVQILIVQTDQFVNAKPARIEQFQNRAIAKIFYGVSLGHFDNCRRFPLAEI